MSDFSRTWWGQRFLQALERFTDPARLARGRTYARNGKIVEYHLEGSSVEARVRGSVNPYFGVYKEPLYTTTITMTPIPGKEWDRVLDDLATKASFVARLLMNEMPESIDRAFGELGVHLLPHDRDDFKNHCSCPDWDNPCKHIAGVYCLLAANLDRDPFLLFELRGYARTRLRHRLESSELGKILSAELTPREPAIEPKESYFTRPARGAAGEITQRDFWHGPKKLPDVKPAAPPTVPALLIKRLGDYPDFWVNDSSFIETMEEIYGRVRVKSPQLR